jgi:hypothetical protein
MHILYSKVKSWYKFQILLVKHLRCQLKKNKRKKKKKKKKKLNKKQILPMRSCKNYQKTIK